MFRTDWGEPEAHYFYFRYAPQLDAMVLVEHLPEDKGATALAMADNAWHRDWLARGPSVRLVAIGR